jgi:signal transduction histidine kinase
LKAQPNGRNAPPEESATPRARATRIVFPILVPLVLAIALLLAAFVAAFRRDQEVRSTLSAERSMQEVQKLLQMEQSEKTKLLTTTLEAIKNDGQLEAAFRAHDRDALLQRAMPLFQSLKNEHAITHFYFELPDRTVLLRLHSPGLSGDKVDRFTILAAERTGAISAGIEHGVTGAFTLRVVSPWRVGGQLLGYLELGIEYENLVRFVHARLNQNVDFIVAIDKKFLDRNVWQTARLARNEPDDWDRYPSVVILNKSVKIVPEPVLQHLAEPIISMNRAGQVVEEKGKSWQLVYLPMVEVDGRAIGQLIVLQDVTTAVAQARNAIWKVALLCLVVSSLLVWLFYLLLTRIERTLRERTASLETEIRDRTKAENDLREAQERIVDTSRRAGMAEVATSVLHNVGNVLNSVNVASSCVTESLKKSKARNLTKVVALLEEHDSDLGEFLTNDPKGKQIPGYLSQLANHLGEEQDVVLKELAGLEKNIEHIKEIVTMQQGYAKASGVLEDALRMNAGGLMRHDVQVTKEYGETTPLMMERSKAIQILINLISNAKYACDQSDQRDKQVVVRISNGHGRARIVVSDNGIGITKENLARIFAHGFTTKKDGHGFGLHYAAITAREMGGSLSVQSEGTNHGATFTLELPGNDEKAVTK